jgi:integrase
MVMAVARHRAVDRVDQPGGVNLVQAHAQALEGPQEAQPRHEVPPIFVFGRRHMRPRPHIYSADELRRVLDAARRLPAIWPLRPQVFTTLFGLLVSSGVRVSEALALRFGDVTSDGLVIRNTKFNKTRLVPLHQTAAAALDGYLGRRRRASTMSDYVFVSPKGGRLPLPTVSKTFLHLARHAGLRAGPGTPGPRIHDLRHNAELGISGTPARSTRCRRRATCARSRCGSATPARRPPTSTCRPTRRRNSRRSRR